MNWRLKRQLIYSSIFSILILLIILILYLNYSSKNPPSCFDGKKNMNEEGVDCGGSCPPCELKEVKPLRIYPVKVINYSKFADFLAVVENPNSNLFLKSLKYNFQIYDSNNVLRKTTPIRETFLEVEQKKYLLEIGYSKFDFDIGKVKLNVFNPLPSDWSKISSDKKYKKLKISFYNQNIFKENYNWKMRVTLFNPSIFDEDLEIIILIYNKETELIGSTKSFLSIKSEEVKNLILTLPELTSEPKSFELILQRASLEPKITI